MTDQTDAAAERSAHVTRANHKAHGELVLPMVEIAPGVWKLRCVVALEAQVTNLQDLLGRWLDIEGQTGGDVCDLIEETEEALGRG